jgi:DNA-binding NarL/FixJ family response regulator
MADNACDLVLLIDDHAMFRAGLRMLIERALGGVCIAEAASLPDALGHQGAAPKVALLDVHLPGLNGLDGIALIQRAWPRCAVVMLSSSDSAGFVNEALARGAAGYVSKADTPGEIIRVVSRLLMGHAAQAARCTAAAEGAQRPRFSARQCDVLDLLCQGLSNKVIGRRLGLSENTVRTHVQAILALLDVASRSEAAYEARRRGMVA